MVIASFIIIFLYPFISTISLQNIAARWVTVVLYLLKFLCGVSWKVTGIENITENDVITGIKWYMTNAPQVRPYPNYQIALI